MAHLKTLLFALTLSGVRAITKELYTTNAVCKQQYCINPVFPGLGDLPHLETQSYTKRSLGNVSSWMEFCRGAVDYDLAVPHPNRSITIIQKYRETRDEAMRSGSGNVVPDLMGPIEEMIRRSDNEALKTYFMHLSAMRIEAWDHTEPFKASTHPLRPCARSVARLACFTYFPRALSTLADGTEIGYTRPCKNACQSYLEACGVDCCDDSTSCTWDKSELGGTSRTTQDVSGNAVLLETGYADMNGPAFQCTGRG
mmetsp:Transcript_71655/g.160462  ORF Transcript_71655/g.160462 Transcript_71655/m.160462 type:complete len:255 (-) Transcript_71655:157-921(-)